MPRSLIDLKNIDLNDCVLDADGIENINPHRFEFRLLDRVVYHDTQAHEAVGIFEVRDNQFWVRGHIPGRPLFPGVLQVEASAQLCSIVASKILGAQSDKFFGFIGVNNVKFRSQVTCGDDLILMCQMTESRRITKFNTQAMVKEKIVFSGEIMGGNI